MPCNSTSIAENGHYSSTGVLQPVPSTSSSYSHEFLRKIHLVEFNLASHVNIDNYASMSSNLKKSYLSDFTPVRRSRVKEIQEKINSSRDCSNLLISYIRQLCAPSCIPTTEDIEYLNYLFKVDQRYMQELSESLAEGKSAINVRFEEPKNTDKKNQDTDESLGSIDLQLSDYVIIESPVDTHNNSERCSQSRSPTNHTGSCNLNGCHKHDLSEMEKELERMKERLEKLNEQRETNGKALNGIDNNTLCTTNRNSKSAFREKNHKVEQRNKCIIT